MSTCPPHSSQSRLLPSQAFAILSRKIGFQITPFIHFENLSISPRLIFELIIGLILKSRAFISLILYISTYFPNALWGYTWTFRFIAKNWGYSNLIFLVIFTLNWNFCINVSERWSDTKEIHKCYLKYIMKTNSV